REWEHETSWSKKAMHSELATVELQKLLTQAGIVLRDLTHLAVNVGPGSFTGLRVGLSLAKSLAYALSLPVWTKSSLELLAQSRGQPGSSVFVALKAVQNFYYIAGYDLNAQGAANERLAPQSAPEDQLKTLSASYSQTLV